MIGKFLDPKNDLAFKRIFGSEKNKDILIHFLNDIFARTTNPIEAVTFLKPNHDPEVAAQRSSIVDVLCQDAEGNRFIIEMQVAGLPGFEKRAQYYAAKTYILQRDKGIEYKDLKEVTFLAVVDYTLFPEEEKYLSHHHLMDTESYKRHLRDFSFSFLELPKFNKSKEQLRTMTEKWAYFFKYAHETTNEELSAIIGSDQIIQRAYNELDRFSWSVDELLHYDSVDMKIWENKILLEHAHEEGEKKGLEKGLQEGEKKGLEKGLQEGEKKGLVLVAANLLSKNFSPEQVCELTGLEMDELPLSVGRLKQP